MAAVKRICGTLLALFFLYASTYAACGLSADGNIVCNYSKTGYFKVSPSTYNEVLSKPCKGKTVKIFRPDKEWRLVFVPASDILIPELMYLSGGKEDEISACELKKLIEQARSYSGRTYAQMKKRYDRVYYGSLKPIPEQGKTETTLGLLDIALELANAMWIKSVKSKLFVDRKLIDVNHYLENGLALSWHSLKPKVTREQFLNAVREAIIDKKKPFKLMRYMIVRFRHNKHLQHVSDCIQCHHTGSYVSCATCHKVGSLDPKGTLLQFPWYAKGKLCSRCHAEWKPIPWFKPEEISLKTNYSYQYLLFYKRR